MSKTFHSSPFPGTRGYLRGSTCFLRMSQKVKNKNTTPKQFRQKPTQLRFENILSVLKPLRVLGHLQETDALTPTSMELLPLAFCRSSIRGWKEHARSQGTIRCLLSQAAGPAVNGNVFLRSYSGKNRAVVWVPRWAQTLLGYLWMVWFMGDGKTELSWEVQLKTLSSKVNSGHNGTCL